MKRESCLIFTTENYMYVYESFTTIASPELITLNAEIEFPDVLKFCYEYGIIHIGYRY